MEVKKPFPFIIAGPCVVEGRDITFRIAETLKLLSIRHSVDLIFKASFEKANRSRIDSFRGIGKDEALKILAEVKEKVGLKILTDIHSEEDARDAAPVADVLQIPAFLCRQTSLLLAAGKTGRIVNIKKGQFLDPNAMRFAADKVKSTGNESVWLTERGTMFGYKDLIIDFRNIPVMKETGLQVVMDATHALQVPDSNKGVTGGQPQWIEQVAASAIIWGADGLFFETHPDPASALSDGANMLPLDRVDAMFSKLIRIHAAL